MDKSVNISDSDNKELKEVDNNKELNGNKTLTKVNDNKELTGVVNDKELNSNKTLMKVNDNKELTGVNSKQKFNAKNILEEICDSFKEIKGEPSYQAYVKKVNTVRSFNTLSVEKKKELLYCLKTEITEVNNKKERSLSILFPAVIFFTDTMLPEIVDWKIKNDSMNVIVTLIGCLIVTLFMAENTKKRTEDRNKKISNLETIYKIIEESIQ